jgi:hypothetical protein
MNVAPTSKLLHGMNAYLWYDNLDLFRPGGRPCQSQHRRRKMNAFAESLRREVLEQLLES